MSDHADWKGLNEAVAATGAETVISVHGYTSVFTRWLQERGYHAVDGHTRMPQPAAEQDPAA
jgi:putative mRNA 3-end processing factor